MKNTSNILIKVKPECDCEAQVVLKACSEHDCSLHGIKANDGCKVNYYRLYLRNKTVSPCLYSLVKTEANVFLQTLPRFFLRVMKARRTCFISSIKLLFSDLTKRKRIREARMYNFIPVMKLYIFATQDSQSCRLRHVRVSKR